VKQILQIKIKSNRTKKIMEESVTIHMNGTTAHLCGDWTINGLTKENINFMAKVLQRIEPTAPGKLVIDCSNITDTDYVGIQLIRVWMQCIKIRGIEAELTDPPEDIHQYFKDSGLSYRLTKFPQIDFKNSRLFKKPDRRGIQHENRQEKRHDRAA